MIMGNTVFVKTYTDVPLNKKEILRYAKTANDDVAVLDMLDKCIAESKNGFTYKVCYAQTDITVSGNTVDLGFTEVNSADLAKNLKNCKKAVIFAASVGLDIDRLIIKNNTLSPAKAVLFQAIGSERVESLCDIFNDEIKEKYGKTRPRFSAGYGDLKLEMQKDIFAFLDCGKKIGISLGENLLMTPSKSVTAIIGVE